MTCVHVKFEPKFFTTKSESRVVIFVAITTNMLLREMQRISKKCIRTHMTFCNHVLDLAKVLYTEENHQKIRENWDRKGVDFFKLLHNGSSGKDGGLASDLERLQQLVTVCQQKTLFAQLNKEKNDPAVSVIECPNFWGDDRITIQKDSESMNKEFELMKSLYLSYFKLLYSCIDYLNETVRPIYKVLGIIECFPDNLDLISPYKQREEEKASSKE